MTKRFVYINDDGLRFTWSGGQYIDVQRSDESVAFTCINVYNMDGTVRILVTQKAFVKECITWYNEQLQDAS